MVVVERADHDYISPNVVVDIRIHEKETLGIFDHVEMTRHGEIDSERGGKVKSFMQVNGIKKNSLGQ